MRLRWTSATDHLGLGTPPVTIPDVVAVPAKVVQVAAGEAHALLLALSGSGPQVFSIGANDYGQLGLGDTMKRRDAGRAFEVAPLDPQSLVAGVACGGHVSMAVSQRGEVWSWGRNEESGVLGHGPMPVACVPSPMAVPNTRRKIRAAQAATTGWTALCVSHLGAVFSWGGGMCGAHGHGHQGDEPSAKLIRGLEGSHIVQAVAGPLHMLALSAQSEVYTWGRIGGALGSEPQLQLVPKVIDALLGIKIVQVAAGGDHNMALAESGDVYAWGAHASGALGGSTRAAGVTKPYALVHKADLSLGRVREIACGRCHSMFLATGESDEGKEKPGDLWICGMGSQATEHVATQKEGAPGIKDAAGGAARWSKALAAPEGFPLKLTQIDHKRVLEMMGGAGGGPAAAPKAAERGGG